jgi:CRISPR-associated protein Cas1
MVLDFTFFISITSLKKWYKENLRFVIWVDDEPRKEIPMREVERILVFGNIQVSTQAIHACLQEQILILFLNLSGYYKGHLWNWESSHLGNELAQIKKREDVAFQFQVSQAIVRGKLQNYKQLLLRLNRKRKVAEVARAIAGISSDIEALASVDNVDIAILNHLCNSCRGSPHARLPP